MNWKRIFKQFVTDPNSPEGMRIRAKVLMEKGYPESNPMVQALLKQAEIKEKEK